MKYIIGLGNPGTKYEGTRHNIGRDALCELATAREFSSWETHKPSGSKRAHGSLGGESVELVLPETFMNKSGEAVKFLADKEGAAPEDLIVIHDEVDLALGELKVSIGRGAGGNNGIESVINHLGTKDFIRLRVGVAGKEWWGLAGEARRPRGGAALSRFVLGKFNIFERRELPAVYQKTHDALVCLVRDGVEKAMNQCN